MAKRKGKPTLSTASSNLLLIGGIILLVVAALGVFALMNMNNSSRRGEGVSPVQGPRLAVDQERIDLGKQPLNKTVRAEFQLKNEGDQVLVLDASTPIRAVEGC